MEARSLIGAGTEAWKEDVPPCDWTYKAEYFDPPTNKKAPGGVVTVKYRLFIGPNSLVYRLEDTYSLGWSGSQ